MATHHTHHITFTSPHITSHRSGVQVLFLSTLRKKSSGACCTPRNLLSTPLQTRRPVPPGLRPPTNQRSTQDQAQSAAPLANPVAGSPPPASPAAGSPAQAPPAQAAGSPASPAARSPAQASAAAGSPVAASSVAATCTRCTSTTCKVCRPRRAPPLRHSSCTHRSSRDCRAWISRQLSW